MIAKNVVFNQDFIHQNKIILSKIVENKGQLKVPYKFNVSFSIFEFYFSPDPLVNHFLCAV